MDAARGLCGAGGRAAQEEVIRRAGPRSRACWQEGRAARVRPLPRTSTLMVHEAWCVSTRVPRPAESSMYTTACVAWSVASPLYVHLVTVQREAAEDQLPKVSQGLVISRGAAALAPLRRCPTLRPHRQHRRSGDHDRRPKSHHRRGRSRLLGHSRSAWWTMGFSAASAVARMAPCVQQGTALRH